MITTEDVRNGQWAGLPIAELTIDELYEVIARLANELEDAKDMFTKLADLSKTRHA